MNNPQIVQEAINITVRETILDAKVLATIADRLNKISTIGIGTPRGISFLYNFNEQLSQDDFLSFMLEFRTNLFLLGFDYMFLSKIFNDCQDTITNGLIDNDDLRKHYNWVSRVRGQGIADHVVVCFALLKMYSTTFSSAILNKNGHQTGVEFN